MTYYIDIPRLKGFLVVPRAASLWQLRLPGFLQAITTERVTAWRLEESGWLPHALEPIHQGIQLTYGELESPEELIRAREALRVANLIDEEDRAIFIGSATELVSQLNWVSRRLNLAGALELSFPDENAKLLSPNRIKKQWAKLRSLIFGIERQGWRVLVLYIPENLGVLYRPDPQLLPYLFTEKRL